eukprot:532910-Pelagomonas_calceolata.AAC.1
MAGHPPEPTAVLMLLQALYFCHQQLAHCQVPAAAAAALVGQHLQVSSADFCPFEVRHLTYVRHRPIDDAVHPALMAQNCNWRNTFRTCRPTDVCKKVQVNKASSVSADIKASKAGIRGCPGPCGPLCLDDLVSGQRATFHKNPFIREHYRSKGLTWPCNPCATGTHIASLAFLASPSGVHNAPQQGLHIPRRLQQPRGSNIKSAMRACACTKRARVLPALLACRLEGKMHHNKAGTTFTSRYSSRNAAKQN